MISVILLVFRQNHNIKQINYTRTATIFQEFLENITNLVNNFIYFSKFCLLWQKNIQQLYNIFVKRVIVYFN